MLEYLGYLNSSFWEVTTNQSGHFHKIWKKLEILP